MKRDPLASLIGEDTTEQKVEQTQEPETVSGQRKRKKTKQVIRLFITLSIQRVVFLDNIWRRISASRTNKVDKLYKSSIIGVLLDILKESGGLTADYSDVETEQDLKRRVKEIIRDHVSRG